jgi:hypothetical protein
LYDALNNTTGMIDVVAYSGGAQAFTTAFDQLTPKQQARIGGILYLSPGAGETLAVTSNPANTTVVMGATQNIDVLATVGTTIPSDVRNVIWSGCNHTDVGCLEYWGRSTIAKFKAGGSCPSQDIFTLGAGGTGGSGKGNPGYITPGMDLFWLFQFLPEPTVPEM